MNNITYEEWNVCGGLRGDIELIGFTYNLNGVEILLESHEKNVSFSIKFEDRVLSFRYADEGDRLKFIEDISGNDVNFYVSYNSEYLSWFVDQGYCVRKKEDLVHYIILTRDDILDIIDHRFSPPPYCGRENVYTNK